MMWMQWLWRWTNWVNIGQYLYCILNNSIYCNIVWSKVIELTNFSPLCWWCWVRVTITCCKYPTLIGICYSTVSHRNISTKTTICRCWFKTECHINMIHNRIFKKNVLNTITCMASCCKSTMSFTYKIIKHPDFWVCLNVTVSSAFTNRWTKS